MLTSRLGAVDCTVIVHDQRAVAVINFPAAVRTTAHTVVATSWHRHEAVLRRRVVDDSWDSASAALLRRVGSGCGLRRLPLLLLGRTGTCGGAPRTTVPC